MLSLSLDNCSNPESNSNISYITTLPKHIQNIFTKIQNKPSQIKNKNV
jgi:hypothetical protein